MVIIKPLFKGGDEENINNYYPTSMLSNFSTIFEKCLKPCLINYLENINFLQITSMVLDLGEVLKILYTS